METKVLKLDEMVNSTILYITVVQGKLPTRKSDIIKFAMNKQSKDFLKVIEHVAKGLRRNFGLVLVGMKNGPNNDYPVRCPISEGTSYITINKFRQRIIAMVAPDQAFATDRIKAALLLILSCSYMMDKTLDEDTIWDMFEKMAIAEELCKKKEDLKRFLKTEYVDPLYLMKHENKDSEQVVIRYGWGIRAEVEFSKHAVLKFVAFNLRKKPEEFVNHFSKISPEEIKRIDEEDELMKQIYPNGDGGGFDDSLEGRDDDDYDPSCLTNQQSGRPSDNNLDDSQTLTQQQREGSPDLTSSVTSCSESEEEEEDD